MEARDEHEPMVLRLPSAEALRSRGANYQRRRIAIVLKRKEPWDKKEAEEAEAQEARAAQFRGLPSLTFARGIRDPVQELLQSVDRTSLRSYFTQCIIADDVALARKMAKHVIDSEFGWSTCLAQNGSEAVSQYINYESEHGDDGKRVLVLLDIDMPVMGGHEAARLIRAYEKKLYRSSDWQPALIFAVTGCTTSKDIDLCKENGCDDVIPKNGQLRIQLNSALNRVMLPVIGRMGCGSLQR